MWWENNWVLSAPHLLGSALPPFPACKHNSCIWLGRCGDTHTHTHTACSNSACLLAHGCKHSQRRNSNVPLLRTRQHTHTQENHILLEKLINIKNFDSWSAFKPWLARSTFQYRPGTYVDPTTCACVLMLMWCETHCLCCIGLSGGQAVGRRGRAHTKTQHSILNAP